MSSEFKLSNLETGMVIEVANGTKYLVMKDLFVREGGFLDAINYEEDLSRKDSNYPDFDIVKVFKPNTITELSDIFKDRLLDCIWERKYHQTYQFGGMKVCVEGNKSNFKVLVDKIFEDITFSQSEVKFLIDTLSPFMVPEEVMPEEEDDEDDWDF